MLFCNKERWASWGDVSKCTFFYFVTCDRTFDFQRKTASVAMKQCCNHPKQYRNKVTTTLSCDKNRGCESSMARGWERWLDVEDSAIDILCCFIPLDPWVCWSFLEGVRLVPLFQYKKWLERLLLHQWQSIQDAASKGKEIYTFENNLKIFLNSNIVGFDMTSLKFKLKNYRSYGDFTFTMH